VICIEVFIRLKIGGVNYDILQYSAEEKEIANLLNPVLPVSLKFLIFANSFKKKRD
jgi:hypothetical protein